MMDKVTPIGITNYQSKRIPFGIKKNDRSGHIYCIGKTGSGKSTLLLNMAIADISHGDGVGIIDPHGDLASQLLSYIPKERIRDVIYFNAGDREYPIAFNPLECTDKENRHLVASAIVESLKKLWIDSWGPRLEHILRNTILSLMHRTDTTMLDIVPMLTNHDFRREVMYSIDDQALREFWYKEYDPLPPQVKQEHIAPIVNKVGIFATHPILRNILGQKKSSFSIGGCMNSKKILIINLSKGHLGEAGTSVLGSLLLTHFQTESLRRAKYPPHFRTPFYLFIDEIQSFMTLSFADMLSESRKYGLCLFLTHQFIDQLSEEVRTAILGNVATLIAFRVGSIDALFLKTEFHPVFDEIDLVRIPAHSIYLKLCIDGTTCVPFSASTHPLPKMANFYIGEILKQSRDRYAKPREVAEGEVSWKYKAQAVKNNHNEHLTLF